MDKHISNISLTLEVDGIPKIVMLPQDKLMLLVKLAASLSEDGKLPVRKAPEGFKFVPLYNN
jgi:hypothetical protein